MHFRIVPVDEPPVEPDFVGLSKAHRRINISSQPGPWPIPDSNVAIQGRETADRGRTDVVERRNPVRLLLSGRGERHGAARRARHRPAQRRSGILSVRAVQRRRHRAREPRSRHPCPAERSSERSAARSRL